MTTVHNLATGETREYSLPPQAAVVAAWEQSCGNYNSWLYQESKAPITRGRFSVSAGDWCALITHRGM